MTAKTNDKRPGRAAPMPIPRGRTIEDEVVIAGGCTIMPGLTIGAGSFVAAGYVVTRDVAPGQLIIQMPGRSQPMSANLDRPNSRRLTEQTIDLWHPKTPGPTKIDWPNATE